MSRKQIQDAIRLNDPKIKLKKKPNTKSCVWASFSIIEYDNKQVDYVCCMRCRAVLAYASRHGTGSLIRHKCPRDGSKNMQRNFGSYTKKNEDKRLMEPYIVTEQNEQESEAFLTEEMEVMGYDVNEVNNGAIIQNDFDDDLKEEESNCENENSTNDPLQKNETDNMDLFGNFLVSELRQIRNQAYLEATKRKVLQFLWQCIDEEPTSAKK